jgi:hypothetical protein
VNELMSASAFGWVLTALTGGLAGTWVIHDAIFLYRSRRRDDGNDPVVRDQRFGYLIGMLIGVIGILGCLKYHNVI